MALARQVLTLARRAFPPQHRVELVLAAGVAGERIGAARVAISGSDALARLLWPPSPGAIGEACLRGDLDIEGDIWAASDAAFERFQTGVVALLVACAVLGALVFRLFTTG